MIAFKRFLVIVVAYALTVFAAALGGSLAIQLSSIITDESMAFVAVLGFAGIVIGVSASIPSAVLILIAEYFGIRSLWYYAAIAVVAGLVLTRVFIDEPWMLLVGAALGVICGATYWAIAGRKAGSLKTPETIMAQTQLMLLLGVTIVVEVLFLFVFMR